MVKKSNGKSGVLSSLVFCCSGTLSKKRSDVESDIKKNGGKTSSSVTNSTNFLITTEHEARGIPTSKVNNAKAKDVPIVSEDFLWKCIDSGKVVDYRKYLLISGSGSGSHSDDSGSDSDSDSKAKKKRKTSSKSTASSSGKASSSGSKIIKFKEFNKLPDEIVRQIFTFCSVSDLIRLSCISKFNTLIADETEEETVAFLLSVRNQNVKSRVENNLFHHIHDNEYEFKGEPVLKLTPEEICNLQKSIGRLAITAEKRKDWKKRVQKAIQVDVTNHKHAKRTDYNSSTIFHLIKSEEAMSRYFTTGLKYSRIYFKDEDDGDEDEDDDDEEEGKVKRKNTYKGSVKLQLKKTLDNIEKFEELDLAKFEEDFHDKKPKIFIDWIKQNSKKLQQINSINLLNVDEEDNDVCYIQQDDMTSVFNSLPKLSFWRSKGGENLNISAQFSHINLKSLVLISASLSTDFLTNLFNAYLPNLTHLELFIGLSVDGCNDEFMKNSKLLSKDEKGIFPSLTYLGLRNFEFLNQCTKTIFESAISKRVHIIDFSLSNLNDKGVNEFVELLESGIESDYLHLQILDLSHCFVSNKVRSRLNQLPIIVNTSPAECYSGAEDEEGDIYLHSH
ncbi:BRCT domain-containing protein [Naegleria gruberi]|uniref:BRCT domain-containing protein n=1 Tax=Naegleria gruberi TaxID=5762 RepID=D2VJ41_NAEGR|nr:BRCT domain-containing protein [Naegleria gruberi]EFC43212.1 BRCT domain-containing protein [Naegleria gruberi]|eukprot:XP_002675956.1 BRCT domain-containing protein [Naegleria gruberi strain NEG-M]